MSLTLLKDVDLKHLKVLDSAQLSLSVFLPLDGANMDANRIRVKNVISEAKTLLTERIGDDEKVDRLIAELQKLTQHEVFTSTPYPGLAILVDLDAPDAVSLFPLWSAPETRVSLGRHPCLTPLLRSQGHQMVSLLCIAGNGLRLFRGHYGELTEETLDEEFPKNLSEVIRFEESAGLDGNEHYRNRKAPGVGSPHGEGPTSRVEGEFERRYFREIGKALEHHLRAGEKVLLAGVHEKLALFRAENDHLPILDEELRGNFEALRTGELLKEANEKLREIAAHSLSEAIRSARELPPERRSHKVEELREAAEGGRLRNLYINDAQSDTEQFEKLALKVMKTGGSVQIVDLPDWEEKALGVYRW